MTDSQRPELTIKEAATACGVSDKTIRRNLAKFPAAYRLDAPSGPQSGPWVIPVTDLIAAGYQPGTPAPPEEPDMPKAEPRTGTADDELRKRIDALEVEAADRDRREIELRHEAEMARSERDAARAELERADQTIEAQATALRMLEAGSTSVSPPEPDQTATRPNPLEDHSEPSTDRSKGRFRRFIFGE